MCAACDPFFQTKRLQGVARAQLYKCGCLLLWLDETDLTGRRVLFGCETVQNSDARRDGGKIPYPEIPQGSSCRNQPHGKERARAMLRLFHSMQDYFLSQPIVCHHYPTVSAESVPLLRQRLRSKRSPTRR